MLPVDIRVLVGRLRREPTNPKALKTARHEIPLVTSRLKKVMSASFAATVDERAMCFRTVEGEAVAWLELEEHTVPALNGDLAELSEVLATTRERFSRFLRVNRGNDD